MSKTSLSSVVQGLGSTLGAVFSFTLAITSLAVAASFISAPAQAASYFVHDTVTEPNVNAADALIATNLVKSAVSERRTDRLAQLEYRAAYTLQPRLIKLGDRYLLTIEKMRGTETLFAAQAKIDNIDELDEAAKIATFEAIDEPSKPLNKVADRENSEESEVAAPYSNVQPIDYSTRMANQRAKAGQMNAQTNQQVRYGNDYAYKAPQNGSANDRRDDNTSASISGVTSSAGDDSYPDHGSSADVPTSAYQGQQQPAQQTSQPAMQFAPRAQQNIQPAQQQYQQQAPQAAQQPAQQPAQQGYASGYAPAQPAARTTTHAVDVLPTSGKTDHWNVGFGPFLSRQLGSDNVMYDIVGGHSFDINSMVSLKGSVEAAFSSGADKAHFFNLAAGGNYYFPGGGDTAPYVTGDIGYGFAQDAQSATAEGFSTGVGGGVEFFRTQQTTLDLLLRYTVIFDNTSPQYGKPSILGARLAVNF